MKSMCSVLIDSEGIAGEAVVCSGRHHRSVHRRRCRRRRAARGRRSARRASTVEVC